MEQIRHLQAEALAFLWVEGNWTISESANIRQDEIGNRLFLTIPAKR
jgi:hypothetical protein